MAWNRPTSNTVDATSSSRPAGRGKMPRLRLILAGAAVVVAIGMLCFWMFSGGDDTPAQGTRHKARSTIREVTPAAAPRAKADADADATERPASGERIGDESADAGKKKEPVVLSVKTNSTGYIIETLRDPDGKERIHVHEPKSPWEFATDRIIATALLTPDDQALPPWPPMSEDEDELFLRSLQKPIKIEATDSEEIRTIKELVASARKEIKERMDNGEFFADVMNDHRKLANENGRIRSDAQAEYNEIVKSGDAESARKYALRVNLALQQMGIRELDTEDADDANPSTDTDSQN